MIPLSKMWALTRQKDFEQLRKGKKVEKYLSRICIQRETS